MTSVNISVNHNVLNDNRKTPSHENISEFTGYLHPPTLWGNPRKPASAHLKNMKFCLKTSKIILITLAKNIFLYLKEKRQN